VVTKNQQMVTNLQLLVTNLQLLVTNLQQYMRWLRFTNCVKWLIIWWLRFTKYVVSDIGYKKPIIGWLRNHNFRGVGQ